MSVKPPLFIIGAGRAQHRAEVDAQGLLRRRCNKSRRDTSTSRQGGVRTWRYGCGPAVCVINRIFEKIAKSQY